MIYSYGTFVPNTFARSPIGEVAREARLALNFGVRVQTILKPLRPDVSLHEVAREIAFIAGVREGFAQLDRGEGSPIL